MRFDEFIGGSYQAAAFSMDQQHTINWYPEKSGAPGATSPMSLLPSPGVEPVCVVYDGVGRGHWAMDGREFGVFGDRMYEISEKGTRTAAGQIGSIDDRAILPVTIDSNGSLGDQLLVVHQEGAGYLDLTAVTPLYTTIAALTGKSTMGAYLDGYGLCLDADTSTLYISALGDFSSWTTGTDYTQRSLAADPWKALKVSGRYVWLFGEFTTEIWQDTGERFPFAPIPNALLDWGIRAQYSAARVGNDVCWLGQHDSGRVAVLRAGGVSPEVISTPAFEFELAKYTDLDGAVGDSYSWNGHTFYTLSFDGDDITWCWDSATNLWHQRGTWEAETASFKAWSPRWFVQAFGDIRCLDRMVSTDPMDVDSAATGSFVYKLSEDFAVDVDGKPIRRVRRAPALVSENKRLYFSEFELHMDTGEAPRPETFAAVILTAQSASISETTLFTTGNDVKSYVVSLFATIATTTSDYSLQPYIWWYVDGVQTIYAFGPSILEGETHVERSVSIRPDANTVVSYSTTYASTVAGMVYGLGLSMATPGADDPQAMLRWSDDGGKTWSREHWHSAGKVGEYGERVHWHRLGMGRRRVFELAVSDSVPWRLTGAYLDVEPEKK